MASSEPSPNTTSIQHYYAHKHDILALPTAKSTTTLPIHTANMPHHPAEENATGSITDQVAKENPGDSGASTHELHNEDTGATSGGSHGKATAMDHMSKGPQISDKIGEPKSKEELKARAAELNK